MPPEPPPHRRWGRACWRVQAFLPQAKTLPQAEFISAEDLKSKGPQPGRPGWDGDGGGTIVCTGTPEEVAQCERSYTGKYLKRMLV